MLSHAYFPNGEHYQNGHHIFRDDRGNTSSFVFENCFQAIPPSNSINRKGSGQRVRKAPSASNQDFLSPPMGNNPSRGATHFSENSYNIQNTHISNIGNLRGNFALPSKVSRRTSTKKAEERAAVHNVPDESEDEDSDSDSEDSSSASDFDEAFSISNKRRRSSGRTRPHTPFKSIPQPDPQPTRYLPALPMTYPTPMTSYDPFGNFSAMLDASMQSAMYGMDKVIQERIQAHEAAVFAPEERVEAKRAARPTVPKRRKVNTPSGAATRGREDVSANARQASCPGFTEYKGKDDAGNTITISKLCSHANCAFLSRNFVPASSGISQSTKSWHSPYCRPACPGSTRHQETDDLGNIIIVSRLCNHESNSKEMTDSEPDTDVESAHSDSDDSDCARAKRASMQPSVQDISDGEDVENAG